MSQQNTEKELLKQVITFGLHEADTGRLIAVSEAGDYIEKINSITDVRERAKRMFNITGFTGLFGKEILVINGVEYEYGFDLSKSNTLNTIGNFLIDVKKQGTINYTKREFFKRYDTCDSLREKEAVLSGEISHIHSLVDRVDTLYKTGASRPDNIRLYAFWMGYKSAARRAQVYFDDFLTFDTIEDIVEGWANYELEKELQEELISLTKVDKIEHHVFEGNNDLVLFIKETGIYDALLENYNKATIARIIQVLTKADADTLSGLFTKIDFNPKNDKRNNPWTAEAVSNTLDLFKKLKLKNTERLSSIQDIL